MPLDPDQLHPLPEHPRMVFLKNVVRAANIVIGDFTYYDDPDGPERFEHRNVLYHFPFIGDKLIIGRFCAIGAEAKFIMNGGAHATDGLTTYPFGIMGPEYADALPERWPHKGDTVIGHDVWIGYDALIMPGVSVGHGAVIGARAVVAADVPPYAIVAGNPARLIRARLDPPSVQAMLEIAWWDWPIDKITRHAKAITGSDLNALRDAR